MAGDFSCARTRDQGSYGLELHQAILSSLRLIWVVKALDNISMSFEGCQHHSSLPMNVPEFDVCAGLVEVLDVVSVSHPGCPHHSSLPVIFPDVDISYHDDWEDGCRPEAYFRHSGDSLTTCPGHR